MTSAWEVLIFDDDLFFSSLISGELDKTGLKSKVVTLTGIQNQNFDTLGKVICIVNLNAKKFDPYTLSRQLKLQNGVEVLGFCGHGQKDLMAKAKEAGCDWVVPNSVVAKGLTHFLKQQKLIVSADGKETQKS